ncbi:uncharacterized protein LOC123698279 [Colias croceus]|uniref:uncharacterized protein LOC123698279 n=1 Tax=Colias crocea TaxID=72248 RepID=UPI001E27CABF|nr:uncharacterized protein LOC123698279 [Colias croceus]XP_045500828.1 uncharacterized protein LOC123698279 [Colias croceus]
MAWKKDGDWKERYSKLYSSRGLTLAKEDPPRRISFMSNESSPYASLLVKLRASREESTISAISTPLYFRSLMSQQSESTYRSCQQYPDLGGMDTLLLDMVRSRSQEIRDEIQDITPALPSENVDDNPSNDPYCMHGFNMRMTERSVSRSRFSRISTRRDMDIPSILAFTASVTSPPQVEIPAFQKPTSPEREDIPRWSIRRSMCPVCSQKWRDRSAIKKIKYSGLKRNISTDLPSVIAPAKIRTATAVGYTPRPIPATVDKDVGLVHGGFRNSSNAWQLTRARKFRAPKPRLPSPEASAPHSSTAPTAKKDLDMRVNRFLTDEFITPQSVCRS